MTLYISNILIAPRRGCCWIVPSDSPAASSHQIFNFIAAAAEKSMALSGLTQTNKRHVLVVEGGFLGYAPQLLPPKAARLSPSWTAHAAEVHHLFQG